MLLGMQMLNNWKMLSGLVCNVCRFILAVFYNAKTEMCAKLCR